MAWHTRPAGASQFPNGTAAQWAAEWFTPIDHTHLNYLKDNLEFLRSPPRSIVEQTPNTPINAIPGGFASGASILTGQLTGYVGGKVYFLFQGDIMAGSAANGAIELYMQFTNSVATRYLSTQGVLLSASNTIMLEQFRQVADLYNTVSLLFIVDASVLTGDDIDWELRASGVASALIKNARVYLREL
jgi:hypothetical protein